ncbi:MAG: hypothetical protein SNJ55_13395 [Chloroherpetonaceae bacterium]
MQMEGVKTGYPGQTLARLFEWLDNETRTDGANIGTPPIVGKGGRSFQGSPKHHRNSRGKVGKNPSNPEKALKKAVRVSPNSPRLVSADIETGEFIVFSKTLDGTYHGHIRSWEQLE